jgi:tetratricopeptide (TPR) repeat protein
MDPNEPYYNLGDHHRAVTTKNSAAQTWFDRGLIWTFGFHHEEAERCFLQATQHDPECAMAYWGVAYALGANYNKTWELFPPGEVDETVPRLIEYVGKAKAAKGVSEQEKLLVNALEKRLPRSKEDREFEKWNKAYTAGMKIAYEAYPDDLDIACLYAEAMMVETPWRLWNLKTGEPAPGSHIHEIQRVLEKGLMTEAGRSHPGLLHLYIHAMEQSQQPELAVPAGDRLLGLVPDAGHLNHMPSHLDILIGDYRRAIHSNALGLIADNKYVKKMNGDIGFYNIYLLHNYASLIYAAMFNGQFKVAMKYVNLMEEALPEQLIASIGHFIEADLATKVMVLVRFGRWEDLLALPARADTATYPISTAFRHYGRGIAFAATSDVENATHELGLYVDAASRVPSDRLMFPNKATDVLKVGEAMLRGEIEYRRRNYDQAFEHLRKSIELYDNLIYGEPWSWMQPTRHTYAALKLEQGDLEEALATYAADLGYDDTLKRSFQHPNNVWALHGYHECLVKLGRKREAAIVMPQLRLALAIADVEIESSCFCRLEVNKGVIGTSLVMDGGDGSVDGKAETRVEAVESCCTKSE